MARQEIKYVCEFCRAKYLKKEKAEQCERSHYQPEKIVRTNYDIQDDKKEYPITISVKLKNGEGSEKTITYSRK